MSIFKTIYIVIVIGVFISVTAHGQYAKIWDKAYGGTEEDGLGPNFEMNFVYSLNGFLYLSGSSISDISGNKTQPHCFPSNRNQDMWLVKIDTSGQIIWDRDLGGSNNEDWENMMVSSDNKLYQISHSTSIPSCNITGWICNNNGVWICKLDDNGTLLWEKSVSFGIAEKGRIAEQIDGNLLIGSSSRGTQTCGNLSATGYGNLDVWLIKLDTSGTVLWDKAYGGDSLDFLHAILPYRGGVMLACTTKSSASGLISQASFDSSTLSGDVWIIRTDESGNRIWDSRFGGNKNDMVCQIDSTNDGGFILAGNTDSDVGGTVSQPRKGYKDAWILKMDSNGTYQWDRRFGAISGASYAHWIEEDPNGGYLVAGVIYADSSGDMSHHSFGGGDYWLLRLDSLGNKTWDMNFGSAGNDQAVQLLYLPNGDLMLFGRADSGLSASKSDFGYGGLSDYWLIKFNTSGVPLNVHETNATIQLFIYPNPSSGIIRCTQKGWLTIYNLVGSVVSKEWVNSESRVTLGEGVFLAELNGVFQKLVVIK